MGNSALGASKLEIVELRTCSQVQSSEVHSSNFSSRVGTVWPMFGVSVAFKSRVLCEPCSYMWCASRGPRMPRLACVWACVCVCVRPAMRSAACLTSRPHLGLQLPMPHRTILNTSIKTWRFPEKHRSWLYRLLYVESKTVLLRRSGLKSRNLIGLDAFFN